MKAPWCDDCATEHTPRQRQARLRPLGDVSAGEVRDRLGDLAAHIWPRTVAGDRKLLRDLREVRGYSKSSAIGSKERLAKFLELVTEFGEGACEAARHAGIDHYRARMELRRLGYRYKRGRAATSGWFRRRTAAA